MYHISLACLVAVACRKTQIMVLDCGGGTIDITSHLVESSDPLQLSELAEPCGGAWGSSIVDARFKAFLQVHNCVLHGSVVDSPERGTFSCWSVIPQCDVMMWVPMWRHSPTPPLFSGAASTRPSTIDYSLSLDTINAAGKQQWCRGKSRAIAVL